jgi:hypothetical protein
VASKSSCGGYKFSSFYLQQVLIHIVVHNKLKCLFLALFFPFNCWELSVVVKMSSYFSLQDGGRKTYCRRKALPPFNVDANSCSLMQIVDHIAKHFMWGSKQYVTFYGSSEGSGDVSF